MSWYSSYGPNSTGRVLHFIYHYSSLHYAENVTVGSGEVYYFGNPFAKYEWKDGIPEFTFVNEFFNDEQARKRATAIGAFDSAKEWS